MNTANTPVPPNDPSEPHRLPSDESSGDATFRVPKGTLVVILTALLAAGGGTGITSIVSNAAGHNDGVVVAVDGVKAELGALRVEIAQVNKSVGDVQARLTSDAVVREQVSSELADHEKRLRDIERRLR